MVRIRTTFAILGAVTAIVSLPVATATAKNSGEQPKGPPCLSGYGSAQANTVVHSAAGCQTQ